MNKNELIFRLGRAALHTDDRSTLDLLRDAIRALQEPDGRMRDILRNNDGDWAKRMDTQRRNAETVVAKLDKEIAELNADKQWLADKLDAATDNTETVRAKRMREKDKVQCGINTDLQRHLTTAETVNDGLHKECERLQATTRALRAMNDRQQVTIDNLRGSIETLQRTAEQLQIDNDTLSARDRRTCGADNAELRDALRQIGAVVYLHKGAAPADIIGQVLGLRERCNRATNILQGGNG